MNSIKKTVLSIIAVMTLTFFSSTAQGQLKIGYIDYLKVVENVPTYLEAERTLQLYYEMSARTLQDMMTELQRQVDDFERKKDSIPEIIRVSLMKDLQTQNEIVMFKQENFQAEYEKMSVDLLKPIEDNLKKAIQTVAIANKITYMLQYDPENASTGLLYVDTSSTSAAIDLTEQVRTELMRLEAIRKPGTTTTTGQ